MELTIVHYFESRVFIVFKKPSLYLKQESRVCYNCYKSHTLILSTYQH